jgi:predicted permease
MFDTLITFAIIFAASLLFKLLRVGSNAVKEGINKVVLNVLLPALGVKTFSWADTDPSVLLVPASAWVVVVLTTLIGLLTVKVIKLFFTVSFEETGVLIILTAFGNVLYLGVPVLEALYGVETVKYALLFDLLATSILAWTLAAFVASYYGDRKPLSLRGSIKTIVTLPPLWGIIVGVLLNLTGLRPEGALLKTLDMLSCAVTPLMIFSVGLSLTMPSVKHSLLLIPFLVIKLILSPLIAFYVTGFIGMEGIARKATVMESAMPVMVLLLIISDRYRLNMPLTALAITMSTALSFITLPLVAYLLERYA